MVQIVRNIVLVLAVVMGAAVAYKSSNEDGGRRIAKAPPTSGQTAAVQAPISTAAAARYSNQLILRPSRNGQYAVVAEVDGVDVKFLVDTGASAVVLSAEDAERIGFHASNLDYSQVYHTANGRTRAAPVTLESISIGQLEINDVEASVNEGELGISLLGMTFLRKLDGYQVENGNLIFFW